MSEVLESRNPLNGKTVGTVEVTPVDQISTIVARARDALDAWREVGVPSPVLRAAGIRRSA
mgnify:CR=1 FL=1